jgi:hypothetical protein
VEDLVEFLPEDWKDREIGMFRSESHPSIKRVTHEELLALLEETEILEESLKRAGTNDNKMAKNRKALEKTITAKKTVKKTAKPQTEAASKNKATKKKIADMLKKKKKKKAKK